VGLRISHRAALGVLAALAGAGLVGCFLWAPATQWESYHAFADQRRLLGVPNALDVLSNLPFLWVGLEGLRLLFAGRAQPSTAFSHPWERRAFAVVFGALVLVAFGSAYYHLRPDTARLFWDRLPITVALTALLGITIAERFDLPTGKRLFAPIVAVGVASALLWRATGELRLYLFVQGFIMLALPVLLLLRPPRYTRTRDLWAMAGLYGGAKLCEAADRVVFAADGGIVSGHTLKHLLAAAAVAQLLRHLRKRRSASA
jgi:hypothetical protein